MTSTSESTVGTALQRALVELVDLALVAKQAHWNVHGTHFRSVHLQLDELVADTRLWADDVAERMSTIGIAPDGRAATVARESKVTEFAAGPVADDKVIQVVAEQVAAVSGRIQETLEPLEEEDLLSQDLLIRVAAGLDKHAWMFRAQQG